MATSRSILSFLSRLWSGWRPRRPPKGPAATPAAQTEPPRVRPDDDLEPDEDEAAETDEDTEDELVPDPFIAGATPTSPAFSTGDLEQRRAQALATAQVGEHKIPLTSLAGPGTLAEALNRLLQEGRVTAQYRDDGDEEPHIIYRQLR